MPTLAPYPRTVWLPVSSVLDRQRHSLRRALTAAALAGMVVLGAILALAAAAGPSFLVPHPPGRFPDWLAGPLAGIGRPLGYGHYAALVAALLALYGVALRGAADLPARWAVTALGTLHLVFALAPPILSPDALGYVGYARLGALHDLNPYLFGPGSVGAGDPISPFLKWPTTTSPYGPLFLAPSYALAPLGVGAALAGFKLLAVGASAGCLALVWSCARRLGLAPVPATLFVGLNPLWLVEGVGGAHNDLLMMLLALLGVRLALASREGLAAGALVAAAGVKATGGLLLPFLLLGARCRHRAWAGAGAALLVLGGAALLVYGADLLGWLASVREHASRVSEQGGPREIARLTGARRVSALVDTAAELLLLGSLALLAWRTWLGAPWWAVGGWATLALLVASTWILPWYVVWLLPLAALAPNRGLRVAAVLLTIYLAAARPLLGLWG